MGNPSSDEQTKPSRLEKEFQVKPTSKGQFVNAQPMWSFNNWNTIPGALLMPQCVAAAHHTIPPGFQVHSVQTQFLSIGTVAKPVTYRVENLSDGKTFASRQVRVEQDGKAIAMTVVGFAKIASVAGRGIAVVEHAVVPVAMPKEGPREECDEMRYLRADPNPTIKGYTLPIIAKTPSPSSKLARHWLRASAPLSTANNNISNLLALTALSDIFLLDSAPRIHGLGFNIRAEPSPRERLARDLKAMTTLNHALHIIANGAQQARVDQWVYVECHVPWASGGRVVVCSRIFSRGGVLLATCAQEGLLLLTESASERIARLRQKL